MLFILLVLYLHLISRLLFHVTDTPPWLFRPVKVSTSSELYPNYFRLPFLFHLPRALRFWVDIFYPQVFFTLRSFPTFLLHPNIFGTFLTFWHNLFLTRFQWESAVTFCESCRASYWSSKHRFDPSVCLIHSNPQSSIQLNFVFMHVNIAKVLLLGETLIRSAATLFNSHENIKQQSN